MDKITVLILTPLALEFEAVARHLKERRDPLFLEAASYELGIFEGKFHKYSIVIREPGMKNLDMALATEKAIQFFQPQIVLLIGIAGGVKDLEIGDVVVAKKVYGYESGKEDTDGIFKSRPAVESFSGELLARAQALSHRDNWKKRTLDGAFDAKILIGHVAAGDKVIADTDNPTYERLKLHYNDTVALEMEAIGFATALQYHKSIHGLAIRGISDLCAGKANADKQNWQPLAADRAAAVGIELLWQMDCSSFVQPFTTMDTQTLVNGIYKTLFPEALKEIGKDFADATNSEIRLLWKKLKPLFITEVEKLAKDPENPDRQGSVRAKLADVIGDNPLLKAELEGLLEEAQKQAGGTSFSVANSKNVVAGATITVTGDFRLGDG